MGRWSEADATRWWSARPWVCGFNFLPSTAVNFLEMWHRDSFDRETIERELGWAADIGFNAFRINPHYLVWKHDRDGLLERLDWIMGLADGLGIAAVPCLFDDCGFGGDEPVYGPQQSPVPGVHNSRAVASPGRAMLFEAGEWGGFETYVRDLIGAFRTDRRILFWDLYNEPGNRMVFDAQGFHVYTPDTTEASAALMQASFGWARSISPDQPLTVAAWTTPPPGSAGAPYQTATDRAALALSDIVTFHAYLDTPGVERCIAHLRGLGRPMYCTEWMARPVGSRIAGQLDLFRQNRIGCFQWGLVAGRTQTTLPWPAELVAAHGGTADLSVWFHDLIDAGGAAFDPEEIRMIRRQRSA